MKYLKKLNNHTAYTAFLGGNDFAQIRTATCFCGSERHVHYSPYVPPVAELLDILYSDANGNLSFTSQVLPLSDGLTPIALCVAKAGFFGTNEKARWISLKYMSTSSPETGTIVQSQSTIRPGNNGVDISTISNIGTTYNGGSDWGYLTADWITGSNPKIPSLFDENNEWNLSVLGTVNSYLVTDIDGKNKTNMILATATAQSDWRTALTITNEGGEGYAPAACCCARYHTLGTQAGDWYLGAVGEMCMAIVQKTNINTKLAAINEIYYNDCINALDGLFPTCDEVGASQIYLVKPSNGAILKNGGKESTFEVIAMLQY